MGKLERFGPNFVIGLCILVGAWWVGGGAELTAPPAEPEILISNSGAIYRVTGDTVERLHGPKTEYGRWEKVSPWTDEEKAAYAANRKRVLRERAERAKRETPEYLANQTTEREHAEVREIRKQIRRIEEKGDVVPNDLLVALAEADAEYKAAREAEKALLVGDK